jgi:RNA-directed DNA polymerase
MPQDPAQAAAGRLNTDAAVASQRGVRRVRSTEEAGEHGVTPAESVEGRDAANGKSALRHTRRAQNRETGVHGPTQVGRRAREGGKRQERWNNLLSHLTAPLLEEAFYSLRKDAAAGADGVTWQSYEQNLEAKLQDLQGRIHRGSYHPEPVRRTYIPKADGKQRPLGIPALEDKVVQQAARWILEPIYESEFIGFSYGFRPGRSQHQALDALHVALKREVNWVLDADLKAFFDSVSHDWMKKFIEHRISDDRMVRLLMKWLKAGVMEEGVRHDVERGTPQGGIISPLMANIFLHYALDLWVLKWRKGARGKVYFVRYADDFVVGLELEEDARKLRVDLEERLKNFELTLHPEKTRVLPFGRKAVDGVERGNPPPESFDFLGFTHVATRNEKNRYVIRRRTSKKKRRAKLASLREDLRRRRHEPIGEQHRWLTQVLQGHYQYYSVPYNLYTLRAFRRQVESAWHRQLQRRSQRARWRAEDRARFSKRHPLPWPKLLRTFPTDPLRPSTKGGSPVRENRPPGSVRGAA